MAMLCKGKKCKRRKPVCSHEMVVLGAAIVVVAYVAAAIVV